MNKLSFVLLICFLISCASREKISFSYIDYTFDSGWEEAFSLRLDSDGTCIIADGRWKQPYYKANVDTHILLRADSLMQALRICQPDTVFKSDAVDQAAYKIVSDATDKHFYVYGDSGPNCLENLSNFLRSLRHLKTTAIDTVINFKSLQSFYPPRITVDSAAFLPPKE